MKIVTKCLIIYSRGKPNNIFYHFGAFWFECCSETEWCKMSQQAGRSNPTYNYYTKVKSPSLNFLNSTFHHLVVFSFEL